MCVNLDYEALSENVIFSEADCLVFHGVYIPPGSQLPMDGLCQRETQFLSFFFLWWRVEGDSMASKDALPRLTVAGKPATTTRRYSSRETQFQQNFKIFLLHTFGTIFESTVSK